ncbi:hypothetical protein AB0K16_21305 [Nonomuraea jabiensis]|uniref:hypothetical protein n=1 Tax=Nonomuraea jabiensis TaxID=882448 RepID=UPI003435822C
MVVALPGRLVPGSPYVVLAVLGAGFGLLMQNLIVLAQNAPSLRGPGHHWTRSVKPFRLAMPSTSGQP